MSGIAGIWHPEGRTVEADTLARMLAWCGAGEVGGWRNGPLGLGGPHVQPAAAAGSPPGAESMLVLAADARIDNRAELRRLLGAAAPDTACPDAALILAAYEAWGTRCPAYLAGDFVFAIWDARRRQLFCARDPMGVRPFYYVHFPGRLFGFGPHVDAFRGIEPVRYRANETMVGLYLTGHHSYERAQTFYEGILRLPAAHAMVVRSDGLSLWCYWQPDPERALEGLTLEASAEAFGEAFEEAVRCRLHGADAPGCMLSGGLDSTSVACVARDVLAREHCLPLVSLSTVFPETPAEHLPLIDERGYMETAVQTGGFEPVWVRGDLVSPLHEIDGLLQRLGQPHDVFGAYLSWEAFRQARHHGVRVLLDGLDGDTTVSHGLDYLTELLRQGSLTDFAREGEAFCSRWRRPPGPFLRSRVLALAGDLARERRFGELLQRSRGLAGIAGISPARLILQALAAAAPGSLRQHARRWRGRHTPAGVMPVDAGFARRIGLSDQIEARRQPGGGSARHVHARQFTSGIWQTGLEVVGALGAAFGLDVRHPFFDRRLIELSVALPSQVKLRDGWTRYVLRASMAGILPEAIRWRVEKADLSPNFNRRLFVADRELIEEALWHRAELIAPYVDVSALRQAYARFVGASGEAPADAMNLFTTAVLSRWLHRRAHLS